MAAILKKKMCLLKVIDDNEEDFLAQIRVATRSRNAAFVQISLRFEI